MKRQFSTREKLERYADRRELQNIMGRMSSEILFKQEHHLFDSFWTAQRQDVCLGVNAGWYVGPEAVRGYYRAVYERNVLESQLLQQAFPDVLGKLDREAAYGAGMMTVRPVDTPVIEIACDGQSAKGIWCIRGSYSQINAGGPEAYYEWGWYAVDFVWEGNGWKIWHMQYLVDVKGRVGSKWWKTPEPYPALEVFGKIDSLSVPEPTVPCVLHQSYTTDRPFSASPRLPEPYESFSDTFSYGLEA